MSRHPTNSYFYPGKQSPNTKARITRRDIMDFREYCTVRDASHALGRSVSNVYTMIYDGRLPAAETPTGLYIKLADLRHALAEQEAVRDEPLKTFRRRRSRARKQVAE